jgi:hypothetical protein
MFDFAVLKFQTNRALIQFIQCQPNIPINIFKNNKNRMAEEYKQKGTKALQENKYDEALNFYTKALEIEKNE